MEILFMFKVLGDIQFCISLFSSSPLCVWHYRICVCFKDQDYGYVQVWFAKCACNRRSANDVADWCFLGEPKGQRLYLWQLLLFIHWSAQTCLKRGVAKIWNRDLQEGLSRCKCHRCKSSHAWGNPGFVCNVFTILSGWSTYIEKHLTTETC